METNCYVAVFALRQDSPEGKYESLRSVIEEMSPGLSLWHERLPGTTFLHSTRSAGEVLTRLREHVFAGDQILVLRVAEAVSHGFPPAAASLLRLFVGPLGGA